MRLRKRLRARWVTPPDPLIAEARVLEAKADASRGDGDVFDADVPANRDACATIVLALDIPVGHSAVGLHVAGVPVEHQSRSEAVREEDGPFGTEVVAVTRRPAALPGLPAGEVRLETAAGYEEGVRVHLAPRPVRRHARACLEGWRDRVTGLQSGGDAAVLVPADR